ncbi:hypothetical protein [uncultured Tateyamaria sp.]|uniref:hypothetical protein n=1 Tax=uncultured Tateyamaria sp. TaxID=455651 RepID=UPI00261119FC|nr:hypothetical protein [uncultured Tateyamaria sp.]
MQAMAQGATPDFVAWAQMIPSASVSNIAREAWLEAGLDPGVPRFSSVLVCAASMMAEAPGSNAIVSVCADGGQGSVILLRKPDL